VLVDNGENTEKLPNEKIIRELRYMDKCPLDIFAFGKFDISKWINHFDSI